MRSSEIEEAGMQPSKRPPPRGKGGGYSLGPHRHVPVPSDAIWINSVQVRNRYGGRSEMWLWRKLKNDPAFPKPRYDGRLMMFAVAELNAYDRTLIAKKAGGER
jgi:hypothetical protein